MVQQAYATYNDIEPSWSDSEFTFSVIGGRIEVPDISGFKFTRKVEVGSRKRNNRVTARTTGAPSYEASCTLYRSGLRRLYKALIEKAPTRGNQVLISLVAFDVLVQHTPPGETEIYQAKAKGCRLLGDSDQMQEGTDADKIELTLNPIEIVQIIGGKEVVLL